MTKKTRKKLMMKETNERKKKDFVYDFDSIPKKKKTNYWRPSSLPKKKKVRGETSYSLGRTLEVREVILFFINQLVTSHLLCKGKLHLICRLGTVTVSKQKNKQKLFLLVWFYNSFIEQIKKIINQINQPDQSNQSNQTNQSIKPINQTNQIKPIKSNQSIKPIKSTTSLNYNTLLNRIKITKKQKTQKGNIYVVMCVHACMYASVYVCMYVFVYKRMNEKREEGSKFAKKGERKTRGEGKEE